MAMTNWPFRQDFMVHLSAVLKRTEGTQNSFLPCICLSNQTKAYFSQCHILPTPFLISRCVMDVVVLQRIFGFSIAQGWVRKKFQVSRQNGGYKPTLIQGSEIRESKAKRFLYLLTIVKVFVESGKFGNVIFLWQTKQCLNPCNESILETLVIPGFVLGHF